MAELNPKEALYVFMETVEDWEPITLWNYDANYYLLYAKDKNFEGEDNYNDPYFLIEKNTGIAIKYSSGDDIDKFISVTDSIPLANSKG